MPDSNGKRIALCLSGGGFRATLFHLGSLRRLNEFGLLGNVDVVCSVSGGSITNGVLATSWARLAESAQDGVFAEFDQLISKPIRDFCREDLRTQVLLWDRLNPINWRQLLRSDYSVTNRLVNAYADTLPFDSLLADLPASPEFVILATNMANGSDWQFRRSSMGDWFVGHAPPGQTSVAEAVAASSAYPVAFPPLQLAIEPATEFIGGHGIPDERQTPSEITLTDGGVYDNLGIEPVREKYEYLIVSDAGAPLNDDESPGLDIKSRVTRSLGIIWNQVGAQRKRWLIERFKAGDPHGAFWSLSSKVENYHLAGAPSYPEEVTSLLNGVRTDLDSFSDGEMACLENQGYALANVAIQKWTPELLSLPVKAFEWPHPEFEDASKAKEALKHSHERGILNDIWKSFRSNG
ncbi:patatin-like phospholipase family protein [Lignipirellula cremea]|uniref:Patatin-like phospholipase n=1 Tax=Lignipirellula cremea TaxID=2528010 RepID=A0A518DQL8_9BACT|nr:patatin-like phospholipase family protein [Lignipirellula cremea]QDU94119.1 Patatin-like phospholipase [Lignipirellula cremea]